MSYVSSWSLIDLSQPWFHPRLRWPPFRLTLHSTVANSYRTTKKVSLEGTYHRDTEFFSIISRNHAPSFIYVSRIIIQYVVFYVFHCLILSYAAVIGLNFLHVASFSTRVII